MKFTNKYDLPEPLVRALAGDDYDLLGAPSNIISVTTLIAPPKQKILEARHDDEIEIDVSERLWLLLGTACHYVTEKAAGDDHLNEERWYLAVSTMQVYTAPIGKKATECAWFKKEEIYVSGKLDLYDSNKRGLYDYKITSIWSWLIEKKMKPEHEAQLNINGFAVKLLGFPLDEIGILMLFRDWSKSKAKFDYPDLPVPMKQIKGPIWTEDGVIRYIRARVELHMSMRKLPDNDIPPCSPEERWAKETTYALIKKGQKKAQKVCTELPTPAILAAYPGCEVVERPGVDTKCVDYCNPACHCHYWQQRYAPKPPAIPKYDDRIEQGNAAIEPMPTGVDKDDQY